MDYYFNKLVEKLSQASDDELEDFLGRKPDIYTKDHLAEEMQEIAEQMPEEELSKFYEKYDIQPNEQQHNCRYSFPYMGETHDKTYCRRIRHEENSKECYVTNKDCTACKHFKSKYIEYPINVNKINYERFDMRGLHETGSLVTIRPCAEEYKNKSYLGIYLGDLPYGPSVSYNEETQELDVKGTYNPAIYVFELRKIIFGMESWWQEINSPEDFKDITDDDINNTPYVKILKDMYGTPKSETEELPRFIATETSDAFSDPEDAFAIWNNSIGNYHTSEDGTAITFATKSEAEIAATELEKELDDTTNIRVIMNIECPKQNVEQLQRILDHHVDYIVDFDSNKDIITSISGVQSYTTETHEQNTRKLQAAATITKDILQTEPSDEDLDGDDDKTNLYCEFHNLKNELENNDLY